MCTFRYSASRDDGVPVELPKVERRLVGVDLPADGREGAVARNGDVASDPRAVLEAKQDPVFVLHEGIQRAARHDVLLWSEGREDILEAVPGDGDAHGPFAAQVPVDFFLLQYTKPIVTPGISSQQ